MLSPLALHTTAATAANDAEVAEVLIPIRPLELERQRRRALPPAMQARARAPAFFKGPFPTGSFVKKDNNFRATNWNLQNDIHNGNNFRAENENYDFDH